MENEHYFETPQLQMPQTLDAERAVLGCLFIDSRLISQIQSSLEINDFFDNRNRVIYKAFISCYKKNLKLDLITVLTELKNCGDLNIVGMEYLSDLTDLSYSVRNVESYIDLVVETSIKRQAINQLDVLTKRAYEKDTPVNEYLEDIEKVAYEITSRRKSENFVDVSDILIDVRSNIDAHSKQDGSVTGLDTGIEQLNKATLGLQKETLIILAARPAMGKSAMALNLARNVASLNMCGTDKNKKAVVAIFSLEMANDQLVERLVASEGQIHLGHLKSGKLDSAEWRSLELANQNLDKLNLKFDDTSSVKISDIRAKCRKLSAEVGLDLVVIDYLQLIDGGDKRKSKQEEVSRISRSLKMMARELKIPVVALAQLSREVEKREIKVPMMADLRDSGSIEQDADIVSFLYRDDYYNKLHSERPGEADLIIAKNRSGESNVTIPFIFDGCHANFTEIKNY